MSNDTKTSMSESELVGGLDVPDGRVWQGMFYNWQANNHLYHKLSSGS
jgi:hypothetical protein